jgi:histidine ammonia-lyase
LGVQTFIYASNDIAYFFSLKMGDSIEKFNIDGGNLTLGRIRGLLETQAKLGLAPEALERVVRARRIVETRATGDRALYGINTGFGGLAHQRIPANDLERLQQNLILSHAVGAGGEVPREIISLMLLLKANGLAVGRSGVRPVIIEYLIRFYNERVFPIVCTKGSLGASGDLAPLAHLTLPMIGLGEVHYQGVKIRATQALQELGLKPVRLEAKEGLALINGTQFMTAYAVHCLLRIEQLLVSADVVAAMTLESIRGSAAPFDARLHESRPHPGQVRVAARMRVNFYEVRRSYRPTSIVRRCKILIPSAVFPKSTALRGRPSSTLSKWSSGN